MIIEVNIHMLLMQKALGAAVGPLLSITAQLPLGVRTGAQGRGCFWHPKVPSARTPRAVVYGLLSACTFWGSRGWSLLLRYLLPQLLLCVISTMGFWGVCPP